MMETRLPPDQMDLKTLIATCRVETQNFFHKRGSDERYCWELFHRALILRDDGAWEAIVSIYGYLVRGWLKHSGDLYPLDLSMDDLASQSFEKLWYATRNWKDLSRFRRLSALLQYLRFCCNSVLIDAHRARQRHWFLLDSVAHIPLRSREELEREVEENEDSLRFQMLLNNLLRNEQERLVIRALYWEGLQPRQVLDAYPGWFYDIYEIYRIRRGIMARLRKSSSLEELLGLGNFGEDKQ